MPVLLYKSYFWFCLVSFGLSTDLAYLLILVLQTNVWISLVLGLLKIHQFSTNIIKNFIILLP